MSTHEVTVEVGCFSFEVTGSRHGRNDFEMEDITFDGRSALEILSVNVTTHLESKAREKIEVLFEEEAAEHAERMRDARRYG